MAKQTKRISSIRSNSTLPSTVKSGRAPRGSAPSSAPSTVTVPFSTAGSMRVTCPAITPLRVSIGVRSIPSRTAKASLSCRAPSPARSPASPAAPASCPAFRDDEALFVGHRPERAVAVTYCADHRTPPWRRRLTNASPLAGYHINRKRHALVNLRCFATCHSPAFLAMKRGCHSPHATRRSAIAVSSSTHTGLK